jgi:hypothetical protein
MQEGGCREINYEEPCECLPPWAKKLWLCREVGQCALSTCKGSGTIYISGWYWMRCSKNDKKVDAIPLPTHNACLELSWDMLAKDRKNLRTRMVLGAKSQTKQQEEQFIRILLSEQKWTNQKCTYCDTKEQASARFQKCGRCKSALYCDALCQSLDWKTHKLKCKN